jgi:hypothetical protein
MNGEVGVGSHVVHVDGRGEGEARSISSRRVNETATEAMTKGTVSEVVSHPLKTYLHEAHVGGLKWPHLPKHYRKLTPQRTAPIALVAAPNIGIYQCR